jgi:hypothetical protein
MSLSIASNNAAYFELPPGKSLDVQINHPVLTRFKTTLVGYDVGNYIIFRHPETSRLDSYKDVLVEGNVVIIRYLIEGSRGECFAFKATIKHVLKHPQKLVFIDYPKEIENRQLRLHQRFVTHLPASIYANNAEDKEGAKVSGIINDISAKGCGFSFKSDSTKVKVNKTQVTVQISFGDGNDVLIPANVCNSRYENGKVFVGIQFTDADKQVKKVLEHLLIDDSALL